MEFRKGEPLHSHLRVGLALRGKNKQICTEIKASRSLCPCAKKCIHLRAIDFIPLSIVYHHVYSREEEGELALKVYTAIRRYFGFDDG